MMNPAKPVTIQEIAKSEPVWDKKNSTFMRWMYFQNGNRFPGYSKKYGQTERRDKTDLITNWILRDLSGGYLDKHTTDPKITPLDFSDWYKQISPNQWEPMFRLDYTCPQWYNTKYMEDRKLVAFLTNFYTMLRNGKSVSYIINALQVKTRAERLDPLGYDTPRFISIDDLNIYTHKLKAEGKYSNEQINHFYQNYKQKYFTKK
jgi:hypothetical protein